MNGDNIPCIFLCILQLAEEAATAFFFWLRSFGWKRGQVSGRQTAIMVYCDIPGKAMFKSHLNVTNLPNAVWHLVWQWEDRWGLGSGVCLAVTPRSTRLIHGPSGIYRSIGVRENLTLCHLVGSQSYVWVSTKTGHPFSLCLSLPLFFLPIACPSPPTTHPYSIYFPTPFFCLFSHSFTQWFHPAKSALSIFRGSRWPSWFSEH